MSETHFQYCQKMVLFDKEAEKVFLARRKGEADYDGTYAFIGGKMETTDGGIIEGLRREKDEEIGRRAMIAVATDLSFNVYFTKKDGNAMILPHMYAEYEGGEIELNPDEYSDYAWISIHELNDFEPKVETVPQAVEWALKIRQLISPDQLTRL